MPRGTRDTGGTRALVVGPRVYVQRGGYEYLGEGGPEWGHRPFEWALSRDERREECRK